MVIPFDRIFTDKDKDPDLFDRIVANELPGVLNRALEGYRRLVVRGTFKLPSAVKNATKPGGSSTPTPYRRSSRPVASSILKPSAGLLTFMLRTRNGPERWGTR